MMRIVNRKYLEIKPKRLTRPQSRALRKIGNVGGPSVPLQPYQKKPWGYEFARLQTEDFDVWELCLNKSSSTSFHLHSKKDAFVLVLDGKLSLDFSDSTAFLSPGECRLLKKGVAHRLSNHGTGPVRILEIESPPNRSDLTRLEDSYGRAGFPYINCSQISRKKIPAVLSIPNTTDVASHFHISQESFPLIKGSIKPKIFHIHLGINIPEHLSVNRIETLQALLLTEGTNSFLVVQGAVTLKSKKIAQTGDICLKISPRSITSIAPNTTIIGW